MIEEMNGPSIDGLTRNLTVRKRRVSAARKVSGRNDSAMRVALLASTFEMNRFARKLWASRLFEKALLFRSPQEEI